MLVGCSRCFNTVIEIDDDSWSKIALIYCHKCYLKNKEVFDGINTKEADGQ